MEAKRKHSRVAEEAPTRPAKKVKGPLGVESVDSSTIDDSHTSSSDCSKTLSLYDLLDFSHLEDEVVISSRFDAIARVLMHEYVLVVNREGTETAFEIQEMEFYLRKAVCHEDPFTHGSEEQKISGRWYFHRAPRRSDDASRSSTSLTGYRGGTRKGLDLTIGGPLPRTLSPHFTQAMRPSAASGMAEQVIDRESGSNGLSFGGILLRSLRGLPQYNTTAVNSEASSVYGPSLLADKILALSGASSISELVETMWGGDTNAFSLPNTSSRTSFLYLKRATNTASVLPQIHKSPRIGLDLSHPGTTIPEPETTLNDYHPRVRFLPKMYRYYTRPEQLVKGRPQSFYGFIHATLQSYSDITHRTLSGDKTFRAVLANGMGLKDTLVKKYLEDFETGRKDGLKHLKLCIGPGGKGAVGSPTSYLKMIGALEAVLKLSAQRSVAAIPRIE